MRFATIIIRVLLGGMYVFASLAYFFGFGGDAPKLVGDQLAFNSGLAASGYIFPTIKTLELICGLFLLSGFFVPLASVVIFPITLNIFLYHAFLAPDGLLVSLLMLLANIYLFYANWDRLKSIFVK